MSTAQLNSRYMIFRSHALKNKSSVLENLYSAIGVYRVLVLRFSRKVHSLVWMKREQETTKIVVFRNRVSWLSYFTNHSMRNVLYILNIVCIFYYSNINMTYIDSKELSVWNNFYIIISHDLLLDQLDNCEPHTKASPFYLILWRFIKFIFNPELKFHEKRWEFLVNDVKVIYQKDLLIQCTLIRKASFPVIWFRVDLKLFVFLTL